MPASSSLARVIGASSRRASVTRGEHQRVIVAFGVCMQNLVGDRR
jgi:hypothetical protein